MAVAAMQPKHSVGLCKTHNKQSYTSRSLAKAAIRHLRDPGMREYQCDAREGYWHIGHLPVAVRLGIHTRDEHYNGAKDGQMKNFSTPGDAAEPLTYTPGPENIRALNGAKPHADNSIETLLASAEQSDAPSAVRLAERIRALVAELVDLIRQSNEERELRERIAELTRQRDEAVQKLQEIRRSSPRGPAASPLGNQGEIRAWARQQGLDVGVRGSIAVPIREAYERAMGGGDD